MIWSFLLAAIGIAGLLLAIRGVWWGWAINLAAQFLWVAFAIATDQYGFIISALAYGSVYAYGAVKWWKGRTTQ